MRLLAAMALIGALAAAGRARDGVVAGPVTLRFPGAEAMSWEDLADLVEDDVRDFARSRFDEIYAADAADRLLRHYRSEGYARAEVRYDEEASRAEHGELVFAVREGPRLLIESVSFKGNDGVPSETLDRFVRRKAGVLSAPILVESRLGSDLRSIETYYAERGWLEARAELRWSAPADASGEMSVTLKIVIREGPRTMLRRRDIVVEGVTALSEGHVERTIRRTIREEQDGSSRFAYHRMLPYRIRGALLDEYGEEGYPFARIEDRFEATGDRTGGTLTLTVTEGSRARVVGVLIEGNRKTPDHVIRREISFDRNAPEGEGGTIDIGDRYDVRRVRNSQLALLRLGLFTSVRIDPEPVEGRSHQVVLRVRVREKESRTLDVRVGWGSYDLWRLGLTYGDRIWNAPGELLGLDFTGQALRLRLAAEASGRGGKLSVRIRDPRILRTRVEAVLDASVEQRENVSFSFRRANLTFGLGRELREIDPHLRVEAAWTYRVTDTFRVVGELDPDFESVLNQSSVSLGLLGDWRDSSLWPTRGWHAELRGEIADRRLGGEVSFRRLTAEGSWHIPFDDPRDYVLSLGVRAGIIAPAGTTDEIPLSERFLSGGGDTVRSYEEQQLGPKTDGEPEGGEASLILNAEYRFPVYKPVYVAVFGDAGNVRREADDFGLDGMRYALGAGLRIRTPVGPLSIDGAWNPEPRSHDPTWAFHFSVGFAF